MASEFLIPHPNIPTADIGLPKLKEVTVKNNENFLALDHLLHEFNSGMSSLDAKIEATKHDHPYAPLVHSHQLTDVEGLIPALEQKAPLVHTHPQYLTEVPSHVHAQAEVDGLLADLAGKANLQHRHNLGDVDALQESLNAKADVAYVSWLESQMAKLTKDYTPLVDGDPDNGDGVVGTSAKAARADHRHPINKTSDVNNIKCDGNGANGSAQIGTLYSYALTDHSHPLNYPPKKPTGLIPDGTGDNDDKNFAGRFGDTNCYADLGHSHALNIDLTPGYLPSEVSKTYASPGSSKYYAQADHVHKLPQLEQSDITGLTEDLDNLDNRITDLENKPDPSGGTVKSVAGVGPDNSGDVAKAGLVSALVGTESGTLASGDHTHNHTDITDWDTATKDFIKEEDFKQDFNLELNERVAHKHRTHHIVVHTGEGGDLSSYFDEWNYVKGSRVKVSGGAGKFVKADPSTGTLVAADGQPITAREGVDLSQIGVTVESAGTFSSDYKFTWPVFSGSEIVGLQNKIITVYNG